MKVESKLSFHITATLYTAEDVPKPYDSPLLKITSTAFAQEGLGGYGPPDAVLVSGEEALSKLAELLSQRYAG